MLLVCSCEGCAALPVVWVRLKISAGPLDRVSEPRCADDGARLRLCEMHAVELSAALEKCAPRMKPWCDDVGAMSGHEHDAQGTDK